jgi:Protein of unknown function (DUF2887)
METDAAFFEIFEANPARFRELTDLPLPVYKSASSQTRKKTLQVSYDLMFAPVNPSDPHLLAELQMYHDQSIFNRADLARAMVWKSLNPTGDCLRKGYQPRNVKGIVIFGERSLLPANLERHPSIEFLFLDELIENLRVRNPKSPLLAVFAPLVEDDNQLEKRAEDHYNSINVAPNISENERKVLGDVFIHLISQRLKHFGHKQIQKMIYKLAPLKETCSGKELIEETLEKVATKMILVGKSDQEITDLTELPLKTIKSLRKKAAKPE